jgi:sulfur relay (sulfurtransferase) complex TusBCD TusD component (DsrE family)
MSGRRLGIVLATQVDLEPAAALAHAARARGTEVALFAMDDGVAALAAGRAIVTALVDDDVDVIACAQSAHVRGLGEDAVGVLLGSQDDHAAIVHKADRVVAFT